MARSAQSLAIEVEARNKNINDTLTRTERRMREAERGLDTLPARALEASSTVEGIERETAIRAAQPVSTAAHETQLRASAAAAERTIEADRVAYQRAETERHYRDYPPPSQGRDGPSRSM